MRSFSSVIADAEKEFSAMAERHCARLEARLLAAGMERERTQYEVARFRQQIKQDCTKSIAALRRECLEVV